MAEKLASLRKKGGGKMSETVLWTNSAPTSSFRYGEVTLSQDIDNFKYIAIKWAFSTSYRSDANTARVLISIEDFKRMSDTGTSQDINITLGNKSSAGEYSRRIAYHSDTKFYFSYAFKVGTSSDDGSQCIPLQIIGLK